MRRILAGSLGLGVAVSGGSALAQGPADSPPRPAAARIVAVQALTEADSARAFPGPGLTARSQMTDATPKPMPMPGTTPPAGSGGVLGQPRTFGQGPSVSEIRNGAVPGSIPPPVMGGAIIPGTTYPVTAPVYPAPGPAYPAAGIPAPDCGLFPTACPDAPLLGGPAGLAAATSAYNKYYVSGEYLLWFTKAAPLPTLLTTSSPASNGILGQPDTQVLLGQGGFNQNLHSGARFGAGYWFGCDQRWGLDGSLFFLGRTGQNYTVTSDTTGVIARPFVNLNSNQPFSEIVTSPGVATGGATVFTENSVWGAEANVRRFVTKTSSARLDLIGGFRYLQVNDELGINEFFARTPNSPTTVGVPNVTSGQVQDFFRTENKFFGGQIGLLGEVRRGRWFGTLTGKVAFGTVYETAYISGRQNLQYNDGTSATFPGGLYALPGANIGTWSQTKFAVVPEVGLNIGYHITPHCRLFFGYTFIYLSNALRPGDQIDQGLDVTRIPNFPVSGATPLSQVRPSPTLRDRDFFTQGLNFGIQFTW